MKRGRMLFAGLMGVVLFAGAARATFMLPTLAPVDRLVANTTAYVEKHPKDTHAVYTLARVHYLAFASKSGLVAVSNYRTPPDVLPDWRYPKANDLSRLRSAEAYRRALAVYGAMSFRDVPAAQRNALWKDIAAKQAELEKTKWTPPVLTAGDLQAHAEKALLHFDRAIAQDAKNALCHHGRACLIEHYLDYAKDTKPDNPPGGLAKLTTRDALDGYRAAFELALKKDGTLKEVHIGLNTLVSYEAGKAILRLLDGDRQYPGRHPLRRNVSTALKKLEALPPGVVTPVIFTRGKHDALADLLAKGKGVRFDLNGDGRVERWPWVRPTTAILVWDPKGTGRITSGRQLFGNATWWLLFEDGYRALDALDDSRDGKLTGNELRGIAVWYDRNANGVSDAGEVTPAARAGIRAIATRSTGSHDGCPMARAGITFDDTTTAHTYDWIASPLD